MRLASIEFLLFFFIASAIYYFLPSKYRWGWLLVVSSLFYISLAPIYLLVLFLIIFICYFVGRGLENKQGHARKKLFLFGLVACVLVLVFFKYSGFFQASLSSFAGFFRLHYPRKIINIVLPIGLSFFVFSALAYLIEIKRGHIRAERHFGILASYLMFFPKIAQGPIERPQHFLPQFREGHVFDADTVASGLGLMLLGYFKKLVIADRLAIYVNAIYGNAPLHNGTSLLLATLFYSFQIYADFSGYTDIALGSARVLGFELTPNFRQPYLASSVKDFWARWHISFSTWLRDYLFLPMAYYCSRKLKKPRYLFVRTERWIYAFAALVTFIICGAWHGESLNFILWGVLFGIYLIFANWTLGMRRRLARKVGLSKIPGYKSIIKRLIVFSLVTFAWIIFRGGSLNRISLIIKKVISNPGLPFIDSRAYMLYSIFGILFLIILDLHLEFHPGSFLFLNHKNWIVRQIAYAMLILAILLMGVLDGRQFIYFQF